MESRERAERRDAPCQLVVEHLDGDRIRIPSAEARHWLGSLRARPGDRIPATDGKGARAVLELQVGAGRAVEARVDSRRQEAPPRERLWLSTRVPGSRFDWLVEKAAELGAWGVIALDEDGGRKRIGRWQRVARAALGQSLGSWQLQIGNCGSLDSLLEKVPDGPAGWDAIYWADPGGTPAWTEPRETSRAHVLLLAGPPEGFTEKEKKGLLEVRGCRRIALGPRRLRSETAALLLLAWASLRASAAQDLQDNSFDRG
jgi:16S rRNA (uracil1498-N3)-methyltransferase